MSEEAQVSLITCGQFTRSWFARLAIKRSGTEWLGPVYAQSIRLASRMSNILRAGRPTASLEEALGSRVIVIRVPDSTLDELLLSIEKVDMRWKGRILALCDSRCDTSRLKSFERKGAKVATMNAHDFNGGVRFVVEGDNLAVAALHRQLGVPRLGTLRVAKGKKNLYFRALEIIDYVLPLAIASERELRTAGVEREAASILIEERVETVARYYRRAGRKGWKIDWASALERMNERLALVAKL